MKLATIRTHDATVAVRLDGDRCIELGVADVGAVLRREDWASWASAQHGASHDLADVTYAPLVIAPDKIICQGLNYRGHIEESGMPVPTHPTLFSKFTNALIGADDPIALPAESGQCDWEAELTVVIGRAGRRIPVERAADHIAGFTIMNDLSMRDWQMRSTQWLQGKSWEASTPLGPWLVTPDESPGPSRRISLSIDGDVLQDADTADLLFGPEDLVAYTSTFTTLQPGDVIATGTPSGVGMAQGRFLVPGQVMVTAIDGLGECRNRIIGEAV